MTNRIMKSLLTVLLLLGGAVSCLAATTINTTNKYAYGANLAWINMQADTANGAVIGEYVCSGYIWGANVGWIHLGDGTPANGIRYQNNSASDYGVNHDGLGNLRGFAYGANIGWINFTNGTSTGLLATNNWPRVNLISGRMSGYAYSANCGWISLSNAFAHVQTEMIQPGADSDADGITDAWELGYTNSLTPFTAGSDTDSDGVSDAEEHIADTSPLNPADFLRITFYETAFGSANETNTLAWTSKETRNYQLEFRTNLNTGGVWMDATSILAPDAGTETTRLLTLTPSMPQRYFRVEAIKPLSGDQ
jgi:hypothetical protein